MCARPYGPRRDCISRLMLDPSSKIPRVMHVRLRGLAIQTWGQLRSIGLASHHETDGTVAKKQTGHRRSTRDVQVPTSSTVLFVKKLLDEILLCSEMPPKSTQDNMVPEAKGIKYDECEMALFRAKLSYHATIDERMASQNSNLTSIAEAQARILKGWEIQMQGTKDLADKNEGRSESDKRAMAQYAWRYTALENAATKTTGKG
ncbi:hypothetical protein N7465_003195 [Penicillium sp. CMV-2018d]|nr:hypothetical protein N7465_003195 [Penicillium sp. CMV-2018d]